MKRARPEAHGWWTTRRPCAGGCALGNAVWVGGWVGGRKERVVWEGWVWWRCVEEEGRGACQDRDFFHAA